MWPVKPKMGMWSNGPAVPIQNKMSMKQIVPQVDDKNCQVNMRPVKSKVCSERNVKKLNLCGK